MGPSKGRLSQPNIKLGPPVYMQRKVLHTHNINLGSTSACDFRNWQPVPQDRMPVHSSEMSRSVLMLHVNNVRGPFVPDIFYKWRLGPRWMVLARSYGLFRNHASNVSRLSGLRAKDQRLNDFIYQVLRPVR